MENIILTDGFKASLFFDWFMKNNSEFKAYVKENIADTNYLNCYFLDKNRKIIYQPIRVVDDHYECLTYLVGPYNYMFYEQKESKMTQKNLDGLMFIKYVQLVQCFDSFNNGKPKKSKYWTICFDQEIINNLKHKIKSIKLNIPFIISSNLNRDSNLMDLDEVINEWHMSETSYEGYGSLARKLGWSVEDYENWLKDPSHLSRINRRHQNRQYYQLLPEEKAIEYTQENQDAV